MRLYDIAIVGASGLVGRKIIQVLQERNFPFGKITAIASDASAGKEVSIKGKSYKLQKLTPENLSHHEFVFFSAGSAVSLEFAPAAAGGGSTVIDNSSAFRMKDNVPLIVPEVNRQDIFKNKGIISNPNCSTIQLVTVLKPLDDIFRIKRVVVSTYQSVSGIGNKGIDKLNREIRESSEPADPRVFPHRIAFNAIPHIDVFFEDGYTKEEHKMIQETKKIMGKSLNITATCVRIPTLGGHSESVNIEFDKKVSPDAAREAFSNFRGVVVVDEPGSNIYPMPADSDEKDEVFVGRIRTDTTVKHGLNLWIVADNVRKGAATNAVQIAEELIKGK